jgi:hypothetical protein
MMMTFGDEAAEMPRRNHATHGDAIGPINCYKTSKIVSEPTLAAE